MKETWEKYITKTSENSPRALMLEALKYVETKNEALDVGAGALVDSKQLLAEGFTHVSAIDNDDMSREKSKEISHDNFSFVQTTFEDFNYPIEKFDFINAQFSLPFIHPEKFNEVFEKLCKSLKKGGVIAGQFFGEHDEWNITGSNRTFMTKEEIHALFLYFNIIKLEETEQDKNTALGKMKHWHEFHFIARKLVM